MSLMVYVCVLPPRVSSACVMCLCVNVGFGMKQMKLIERFCVHNEGPLELRLCVSASFPFS